MKKNNYITFALDSELLNTITKEATNQERPLSQLVYLIIKNHFKKKGVK